MTRLWVGLLWWALCLAVGAQPAEVPAGHPPLISVIGKSEIWVQPDQIEFSVHLSSENAEAGAAMMATQQEVDKLRQLLSGYKVEPSCFQATEAGLERQVREKTKQKFFLATRECAFTLSDVKQRERLLLAIANGKIGEVRSVQASLKDPIPVRQRARLQALQEASHKAQAMAASLQQSIGKAYWIEEVPEEYAGSQHTNRYYSLAPPSGLSGLGLIHVEAVVRVAFLLN